MFSDIPIKNHRQSQPSMARKKLTVRLRSQAEADRWHAAASDLKFSTMNKFIRTLVTNSIKDKESKQEEIEQRNRERIEELEHEFDLKKAEVGERDRIIRSLKDEVMSLRKEGYSEETINWKKGLVAEFQHILKTNGRMSRQVFLEHVRSKYTFVGLGKLLIEVERELTQSGLISIHEGGEIEWNLS